MSKNERRHNLYLNVASMMIAIVFATMLAVWFSVQVKTNFEDAATFGANTTTIAAISEGHLIHCLDASALDDCVEGSKLRGSKGVSLWLGNSQLHAINQYSVNDETAPKILFDSLKKIGIDLIAASFPNANLQEHLLVFDYLSKKLPVNMLILPVVFDDMRENGTRDSLLSLKRVKTPEANKTLKANNAPEANKTLKANNASEANKTLKVNNAPKTNNAIDIVDEDLPQDLGYQKGIEEFLNAWLEKNSAIWAMRPEMRGSIIAGLYKLRNYIFNINASTKRKVIPGNYKSNMKALTSILMLAKQNNIQVLLYIAPIRQDVPIPYDSEEYVSFKKEVQRLSEIYRGTVNFINYEDIVPPPLWGLKDSTGINAKNEIDFMHFTSQGHRVLAGSIFDTLFRLDLINIDINK